MYSPINVSCILDHSVLPTVKMRVALIFPLFGKKQCSDFVWLCCLAWLPQFLRNSPAKRHTA